MQITLGQACEQLAPLGHAYGMGDIKQLVNRAVQALSGMSGWHSLRKVLRFSTVGPEFVLPQGCAGLVRACVNGSPVTMRGQDFRFLHAGPSDARKPPAGFRTVPSGNIIDLGFKPVVREPSNPFRLFAYADGEPEFISGTSSWSYTDVQPQVTVRGISPDGRNVLARITPYREPFYNDVGVLVAGTERGAAEPTSSVFQVVTSVTLDRAVTRPVVLYAKCVDHGTVTPIGFYDPRVLAPTFRHYEIQGVPKDQPIEIIAETRVDPLPLTHDSDVLPFESLEPIEYMIQSFWQMKAGELARAETLRTAAAKWLAQLETTNETVQTELVINSKYNGSPGEVSDESWNV